MFLDTTFCIDLLREARGRPGPATVALEKLGDSPLLLSVFVACELQAGARLSAAVDRNLHGVEHFLDNVTIVYPEATFAVAYGELEADLRRSGAPIPTMDLLIGTTAQMHGIPLLTRDARHYSRIRGLVVETY